MSMAEVDSETDEEVSLEDTLLLCARRGQYSVIEDILSSRKDGKIDLDINCKGTQKSNRGWTPLHLASYFGHKDVVKLLLEKGASVNEVNNVGDTPLHRAAHTGRLDVVTILLQYGADIGVINAEGHTAKDVTKNGDIIKLIEATENHEKSRLEEEFMSSVRLGELDKVEGLVASGKVSKVNCQDSFGNTALHVAAQAGQQEVAVYLLQKGIKSDMKNKQGQAAYDVAKTETMKQLLTVKPKTEAAKVPQRFEGILMKRSFVGTKPVWAVLERGVLSFFKNRGDASTGTKRLGMKYLDEAEIMVHSENDRNFLIKYSDGTSHKLQIDLHAGDYRIGREPITGEKITRQILVFTHQHVTALENMVGKGEIARNEQFLLFRQCFLHNQMWINALKEHIHYNTHYIHKGQGVNSEPDLQISSLEEALKVAKAHQDVLQQQVSKVSAYLNQTQGSPRTGNAAVKLEAELIKIVNHSTDMCSSLNKCLSLFKQQEEVRENLLHEEREKNRVLQEALHALAIEHHELEKTYSQSLISRSHSVNTDEFFDCDDMNGIDFHRPLSPGAQSRLSVVSDALSFHSCQFDADDEPIDFFEPVAMETEQSAMTDVIDIEGGGDMLRGRVTKEDGPPSVDVNCLVNKQSDLGGSNTEKTPMETP